MNDKFYNKLIKISKKITLGVTYKFTHCAYIVYKKKILSVGCNNPKRTHPLIVKYNNNYFFQHAEAAAIISYEHEYNFLKYCDLYSLRLNKQGLLMLAYPCQACLAMIKDFGIKSIYYSTSSGGLAREIIK